MSFSFIVLHMICLYGCLGSTYYLSFLPDCELSVCVHVSVCTLEQPHHRGDFCFPYHWAHSIKPRYWQADSGLNE